jgi:hypothetical protein
MSLRATPDTGPGLLFELEACPDPAWFLLSQSPAVT